MARLDTCSFELTGRTDAREKQQLRRAEGARGQDHLARGARGAQCVPLHVLHANRAGVLDEDPGRVRSGLEVKIASIERGREIRNGGTFAAPAANREIGQSEALRLDAV